MILRQLNKLRYCHFSTQVGKFGLPSLYQPNDFLPLAQQCINKCNNIRNEINKIESANTLVLKLTDTISNELCLILDAAELCRSVHIDDDWKSAADQVFHELGYYMESLNTSKDLYLPLKEILDKYDKKLIKLTEEEQRVAIEHAKELKSLHEMSDKDKQISVDMKSKIYELEVAYVRQCNNNTNNENVYENILNQHSNDSARENAFKNRYNYQTVENNLNILQSLLTYRYHLAKLKGNKSYAHYVTSTYMSENPSNVEKFLINLAHDIKPMANKEIEKITNKFSLNNLQQWNVNYYKNLYQKKQDNNLSSYFSIDNVFKGLEIIMKEVFQCTLKRKEWNANELWNINTTDSSYVDSGLYSYDIYDDKNNDMLIGTINFDLFARKNKFQNAGTFAIRNSCNVLDLNSLKSDLVFTRQKANVAVLLSLSPKTLKDGLSHYNVETIFHEMGHCLHYLFFDGHYQHFSGPRAELDFAEVPSIFMENFANNFSVIEKFAINSFGHRLSIDEFNSYIQMQNTFIGLDTQYQVILALFDQYIHSNHLYDSTSTNTSTTEIMKHIQNTYSSLKYVDNTHWHASFSHLAHYGGGYYTYLYGKAMSQAIWHHLFDKDPLNPIAGNKLRHKLLKYGGSRKPLKLIQSVLDNKDITIAELSRHVI